MVQELLSDWDAFTRGCSVRVPALNGRGLMARDHVIVRGFFDFRTVDFGSRLLGLEVEILNRLSVALNSSMMSDHRRLARSRIRDIGRSNFLLAFLLEGEY